MRYIRHGNGILAMCFKMSVGNNKLSVNGVAIVAAFFNGLKSVVTRFIVATPLHEIFKSHRLDTYCNHGF